MDDIIVIKKTELLLMVAEQVKRAVASALSDNNVRTVMTSTEASEYLRISEDTLRTWRSDGRGPKYSKLGSQVRYKRSDLDAWIERGMKITIDML
jgi:excisionase family DNA binding protein